MAAVAPAGAAGTGATIGGTSGFMFIAFSLFSAFLRPFLVEKAVLMDVFGAELLCVFVFIGARLVGACAGVVAAIVLLGATDGAAWFTSFWGDCSAAGGWLLSRVVVAGNSGALKYQ